MIDIEKQNLLLQLDLHPLETEKVILSAALGRILQENVYADMDMPPFRKSSVDGFACRREDLGNQLELLEVIQAGAWPNFPIQKNQTSKIMTGAPVPEGADCVFMVEDSEYLNENTIICNNLKTKNNICFQGEDFVNGAILIKPGTRIKPHHIGIMAGVGHMYPVVSRIPKIAIFATGTELVEPQQTPKLAQIRNSNSLQINSLLHEMGMHADYLGIIPDNPDMIEKNFMFAVQNYDITILTGGASVGDFDFIPELLKKMKATTLMDRTGIQPGNPMSFSIINNKYVFGLSGNPVSSFVQFLIFVKPFLLKLSGYEYENEYYQVSMQSDFVRKKAERVGIYPVKLNKHLQAEIISYNGSAHLAAYAEANALLFLPKGVTQILKGEMAYVRPL